MPSTQVSISVHVVFSTKDRRPLIDPVWESELHAYLGGAVNALGAQTLGVGGTADHIHLLLSLGSSVSLEEIVREIKKSSRNWANRQPGTRSFAWQTGYGAFSISFEDRQVVQDYIRNQHKHHRHRTFREEFLELLEKYQVDYNPKYLD